MWVEFVIGSGLAPLVISPGRKLFRFSFLLEKKISKFEFDPNRGRGLTAVYTCTL